MDATWTVNGPASGKVVGGGTTNFSGFEVLRGGIGVDTFKVDGASGVSVDGGAGSDVVVGPAAATNWSVAGAGSGTVGGLPFLGMESLTGGAGADTFAFGPGGSVAGTMDGKGGINTLSYAGFGQAVTINLQAKSVTAGGSPVVGAFSNINSVTGSVLTDTLVGPNANTTWTLSGAASGTVGSTGYTGIENLTGGTGTDTFKVTTGSIAGALTGSGADKLDYSTQAAGVSVNLAAGAATGLGAVTGVLNVTGGAGNDRLVGDGGANSLVGGSGDDVLLGLAGNDTLDGGNGRDILVGGSGSDSLIGGGNDDLLMGAGLTYITEGTGALNLPAIDGIVAEWTKADANNAAAYSLRVAHLRGATAGGLNGDYTITSASVADDGAADTLTGGGGLDWFVGRLTSSPLDTLTDKAANETATDLP